MRALGTLALQSDHFFATTGHSVGPVNEVLHYPAIAGCVLASNVQGYLAHKKPRPLRTLQKDYAKGPMVVLGGGAVSYVRGTPVCVWGHIPVYDSRVTSRV